jgi:hypothetical protein
MSDEGKKASIDKKSEWRGGLDVFGAGCGQLEGDVSAEGGGAFQRQISSPKVRSVPYVTWTHGSLPVDLN